MTFLIIASGCLHLLAICWLYGQEKRIDRLKLSHNRHCDLSTESNWKLKHELAAIQREMSELRRQAALAQSSCERSREASRAVTQQLDQLLARPGAKR